MADINPTMPSVGEANATADASVLAALQSIVATINDLSEANLASGAVSADKLTASLAAALGVSRSGEVRRGSFTQATESSAYTDSSAYGNLSNGPDIVENIVVPSAGILWVYYRALWRGTHATGASTFGYASLYLNATQLKRVTEDDVPQVQHASLTSAVGSTPTNTTATGDALIFTTQGEESRASGDPAFPGSPRAMDRFPGLEGAYASTSAATDTTVLAAGVNTGQLVPGSMFIPIEVDAGTYSVKVVFKAASGCSLYVKDRRMFAFSEGF